MSASEEDSAFQHLLQSMVAGISAPAESSTSTTGSAPLGSQREQLQLLLKIMEEKRKLQEEERKSREVQLEILKVLKDSNQGSSSPAETAKSHHSEHPTQDVIGLLSPESSGIRSSASASPSPLTQRHQVLSNDFIGLSLDSPPRQPSNNPQGNSNSQAPGTVFQALATAATGQSTQNPANILSIEDIVAELKSVLNDNNNQLKDSQTAADRAYSDLHKFLTGNPASRRILEQTPSPTVPVTTETTAISDLDSRTLAKLPGIHSPSDTDLVLAASSAVQLNNGVYEPVLSKDNSLTNVLFNNPSAGFTSPFIPDSFSALLGEDLFGPSFNSSEAEGIFSYTEPTPSVLDEFLARSGFDLTSAEPLFVPPPAIESNPQPNLPIVSATVDQPGSNAGSSSKSNLSAQVFSEAASKASKRKRTVEEKCACKGCKGEFGVVHLRGTAESLEVPYVLDFMCSGCSGPIEESDISASGTKLHRLPEKDETARKKRKETPVVRCDVCKQYCGKGRVKVPIASSSDEIEFMEPEFTVTFVCRPCDGMYMFCSECGGGGKQRTGKWRPKEMFAPGRKTCSLSHLRIGNATVMHRVIEAPTELTHEILEGIRSVFWECHLSLYAVGSYLTSEVGLAKFNGSMARVRQEIDNVWNRSVLDVLQLGRACGLPGMIYLVLAWIDKEHRNKGKKRGGTSKGKAKATPESTEGDEEEIESSSWLTQLSLEGVVSPASQPADSGTVDAFRTSFTSDSQTLPDIIANPRSRAYVAFVVLEWDKIQRSLLMVQMTPRSAFLPTTDSYVTLIKKGLERVMSDSRKDELIKGLEHLWCWTRNDHERLQAIPERLGFSSLVQYVRGNPDVELNSFARPEYAPMREEGVAIFVTSVREFLRIHAPKKKA